MCNNAHCGLGKRNDDILIETLCIFQEVPTHSLLTVNMEHDLSDAHLRPDFNDPMYEDEDSSEDSFADLYDREGFNDFFAAGYIT